MKMLAGTNLEPSSRAAQNPWAVDDKDETAASDAAADKAADDDEDMTT